MAATLERIPLPIVRGADVIFRAINPAVDTAAVGQCIKKDRPGVVTGKCPIAVLPQLSIISWEKRADLCLNCDNRQLNGVENSVIPGRLDYGSTASLKIAVERDKKSKFPEPSEEEVREVLMLFS